MAHRFRYLGVVLLLLAADAVAIKLWPASMLRDADRRSVPASNLRQIGQASLIYASEHKDKLPVAENVWDYAGALARDGGLDDATTWVTGTDPANVGMQAELSTVLRVDRSLALAFRKLAPSWAVPLGQMDASMPSTTPIAWTRGLKSDGTWSPHSPYGTEGG